MNTEQRIKQIADEAIEKIRAIAAEKDEWPKLNNVYAVLNVAGKVCTGKWRNDEADKAIQARRRIAPNTDEGSARLERLAEWEVFFADFMTAGDAEPGALAWFVEPGCFSGCINLNRAIFGAVGQRGFTTEAKRDEWINKWGRDYVEKMLKGGMP